MGEETLTWAKEVITDGVHALEYPPASKQTAAGNWIINYNLNPELMTSDGFRAWSSAELAAWHEQYDPAPDPRTTCTKYELVTVLSTKFPALLESLKTAYQANSEVSFFWNTVVELDRNNADFLRLAASLGVTEEQLDAIFEALG